MDILLIIKHGLICSGLITLSLLWIGLKNPRIMLQDYPKSIQEAVPPKTSKEAKQTYIYGLPFLALLLGYPLWFSLKVVSPVHQGFWEIFAYVWGLLLFFNIYDLLILDWLIICYITPRIVVIPGTEGNKGYKDYRFHFIGFLKGLVITFLLAIAVTALTIWFR